MHQNWQTLWWLSGWNGSSTSLWVGLNLHQDPTSDKSTQKRAPSLMRILDMRHTQKARWLLERALRTLKTIHRSRKLKKIQAVPTLPIPQLAAVDSKEILTIGAAWKLVLKSTIKFQSWLTTNKLQLFSKTFNRCLLKATHTSTSQVILQSWPNCKEPNSRLILKIQRKFHQQHELRAIRQMLPRQISKDLLLATWLRRMISLVHRQRPVRSQNHQTLQERILLADLLGKQEAHQVVKSRRGLRFLEWYQRFHRKL